MSGRHIGNNIRLILDLIDYINENSYILSEDYYEAFDTVDHKCMYWILDFFGLGIILNEQFKHYVMAVIVHNQIGIFCTGVGYSKINS